MKNRLARLAALAVVFAAPAFAATPHWTSAPQASADESAVLATVGELVKGISTHDVSTLRAVELPEGGGVTIAMENADGTRKVVHQDWEQINARIQSLPPHYEDRLSGQVVTMDGDIAMVRANFVVYVDGKARSCGVDHYEVVRRDGAWKIAQNTWSQRATGCDVAQ
jgi:hypothetical protein